MKLTFLGTGTSQGIPEIGCDCKVCNSKDIKDKRNRCSILLSDDKNNILVDCGPDFRHQALKANIKKIDYVLITHTHADHIFGLDDLRVFANNLNNTEALKIFCNSNSIQDIKLRFNYLFKETQKAGGKLKCTLHNIEDYATDNPLLLGKIAIEPIPLMHGNLKTCGYLFRPTLENGIFAKNEESIAYLTDCNQLADSSYKIIQNIGTLIIDGLRERPHSTHFNFVQAFEVAKKVNAKKTYTTHMCHDFFHTEIEKKLNEIAQQDNIFMPSYDGLTLFF